MVDIQTSVRAACDAAWSYSKCVWPDCSCLFDGSGEVFLTALLSAAELRGAEKVAARVFAIAYPHPDAFNLPMLERIANAGSRLDQIAELTKPGAIRNRKDPLPAAPGER